MKFRKKLSIVGIFTQVVSGTSTQASLTPPLHTSGDISECQPCHKPSPSQHCEPL